ncbi:MAG: hypothetical protein F4181_11815 [Proteobacteria bacterium]|nr:hypothetical protein [Pseudomonadota bacterium]
MSLLEFFYWLEYLPLLVAMRSSPWLFPAIATAHLLGLAIIGGAVLVVDLRLLGLGLIRQPVAQLARNAEPLLFIGIAFMLLTGPWLFMCFATKYYYLTAFWVKLVCFALVLLFTLTVRRRVVMGSGSAGAVPKLVAAASLSLWFTVALGGRLIGFP